MTSEKHLCESLEIGPPRIKPLVWRRTMKRLLLRLLFASFTVVPAFHFASNASAKDLKIAMIPWRGETEAEKGFRDGLKAVGYSVQYTVMNAGQDRTELGRLMREELKPKLDNFD